jgi:uncharacterized membrane protein YhaH (DUF805 family)
MSWYLVVLKKYAVFNGRARRREYWSFYLYNLLIVVLFISILSLLGNISEGLLIALSVLIFAYSLAIILPAWAVAVCRLHDSGRSGWWLLVSLIPFIGGIWLLVLFLTDSQPGENAYGPDPKGVG